MSNNLFYVNFLHTFNSFLASDTSFTRHGIKKKCRLFFLTSPQIVFFDIEI